MATEVLMPALSPTMEEGTLAKWLVKEGDVVKSGQILARMDMRFSEADRQSLRSELASRSLQLRRIDAELADPNIKYDAALGTQYEALYFQQQKGPFADADYRQAFSKSVDMQGLYDQIYKPFAQIEGRIFARNQVMEE